MSNVIRMCNKTAGDGSVLSGSIAMQFGYIGVARQGNLVNDLIPSHGRTMTLLLRDKAAPITFHGHRCTSACTSISSVPQASAS